MKKFLANAVFATLVTVATGSVVLAGHNNGPQGGNSGGKSNGSSNSGSHGQNQNGNKGSSQNSSSMKSSHNNYKNYAQEHGKKFSGGYCYEGSKHNQWSNCYWNKSCGCYNYYCPSTCQYYYWCDKQATYYPVSCYSEAPATTECAPLAEQPVCCQSPTPTFPCCTSDYCSSPYSKDHHSHDSHQQHPSNSSKSSPNSGSSSNSHPSSNSGKK